MTAIQATYENGLLRPRKRLPLRNHEVVILRFVRRPDPVEGTRGLIQVSRPFARQLTSPHRFDLLDR